MFEVKRATQSLKPDATFEVVQPVKMRLILTAIYMAMVTLGFFVMLLVMSFNVGIFVTVVLGLTIGHALMPKVQKLGAALGLENVVLEKSHYNPEFEKCCTTRDEVWIQTPNSSTFFEDE